MTEWEKEEHVVWTAHLGQLVRASHLTSYLYVLRESHGPFLSSTQEIGNPIPSNYFVTIEIVLLPPIIVIPLNESPSNNVASQDEAEQRQRKGPAGLWHRGIIPHRRADDYHRRHGCHFRTDMKKRRKTKALKRSVSRSISHPSLSRSAWLFV